jgi:hypothetical protein
MHITKKRIKEIIREELRGTLEEWGAFGFPRALQIAHQAAGSDETTTEEEPLKCGDGYQPLLGTHNPETDTDCHPWTSPGVLHFDFKEGTCKQGQTKQTPEGFWEWECVSYKDRGWNLMGDVKPGDVTEEIWALGAPMPKRFLGMSTRWLNKKRKWEWDGKKEDFFKRRNARRCPDSEHYKPRKGDEGAASEKTDRACEILYPSLKDHYSKYRKWKKRKIKVKVKKPLTPEEERDRIIRRAQAAGTTMNAVAAAARDYNFFNTLTNEEKTKFKKVYTRAMKELDTAKKNKCTGSGCMSKNSERLLRYMSNSNSGWGGLNSYQRKKIYGVYK